MMNAHEDAFLKIWPKCFITFVAFIELIIVIFLFLTELGNVAAHFWYGNVFAGGWCGVVMLFHNIFLFASGACSPSRKSSYLTMLMSVLGSVASTALISFDAVFLINSKICILTPSCTSNAQMNSTFSSSLQSSFITTFRTMDLFKSYTETQAKLLFQSIQIGLGGVCLLICISFIIIFYTHDKRAKEHQTRMPIPSAPKASATITPMNQPMIPYSNQNIPPQSLYPVLPQGSMYARNPYAQSVRSPMAGVQSTMYYQNQVPMWRPPPSNQPQRPNGHLAWNGSYG